jgi:hypothetical protein
VRTQSGTLERGIAWAFGLDFDSDVVAILYCADTE